MIRILVKMHLDNSKRKSVKMPIEKPFYHNDPMSHNTIQMVGKHLLHFLFDEPEQAAMPPRKV